MAVVVTNTFLDVPEHKFLSMEGLRSSGRRSYSAPRCWKPVPVHTRKVFRRSLTLSSSCSTQSDVSDSDSLENLSCSVEDGSPTEYIACSTPSSFSGSPRGFGDVLQCHPCEVATEITCGASAAVDHQPMCSEDSQVDAIVSCIQLALSSCGQTCQINTDRNLNGTSATLIAAELRRGPNASARSYDVLKLAKKSLEIITSRLQGVSLLSARVQKEEWGYSLRSSVACVPEHAQDKMCWDFFKNGRCPRRNTCRWYHPQDADIRRVKVSVRYPSESTCEEGVELDVSSKKQKISLGELVL